MYPSLECQDVAKIKAAFCGSCDVKGHAEILEIIAVGRKKGCRIIGSFILCFEEVVEV